MIKHDKLQKEPSLETVDLATAAGPFGLLVAQQCCSYRGPGKTSYASEPSAFFYSDLVVAVIVQQPGRGSSENDQAIVWVTSSTSGAPIAGVRVLLYAMLYCKVSWSRLA